MNSQIAISGECYGITSLRNHRRFDRSCRIFLCHVFATKTNKYFQRQAETTLGRPHTRKWFNNPLLAKASLTPYPHHPAGFIIEPIPSVFSEDILIPASLQIFCLSLKFRCVTVAIWRHTPSHNQNNIQFVAIIP